MCFLKLAYLSGGCNLNLQGCELDSTHVLNAMSGLGTHGGVDAVTIYVYHDISILVT